MDLRAPPSNPLALLKFHALSLSHDTMILTPSLKECHVPSLCARASTWECWPLATGLSLERSLTLHSQSHVMT